MDTKAFVRWSIFTALFLIPFIPLFTTGSLFFPFITGKNFAFRILVEVALVAWGVLMLIDPKYRPKFSWTLVLYGALVGWMFIANLLAVNPHKAFWSNYERMDGWVTLVHVFAFFLVAAHVLTVEKLWRKWWMTFVGASAFVCLFGFLQIGGVFPINQGGVRVDATMGNAAYLATYLLFVIASSLWLAFESRGGMRYALLVLAVLQTALLFLTATRGAILGFVGAAVLAGGIALYGASGKAKRYAVGALAAVILVIGVFFAIKDTPFVQNDPTLARLSSITLADGATRFTLWEMAGKGVMERPITGWGQEGFNYVFTKHYEPSLYAQEPWFDRAHNVFIDWLIAGGIPAFILFILLLAVSALTIYRKGTQGERIFLIAAIAAYAFQALFVFDNLFSYVPLAAILAIAHSISSRPIQKFEDTPALDKGTADTIALPVAAVVLAVLIWTVNVPSMLAANDLIKAIVISQNPQVALEQYLTAVNRGGFASQEVREQMSSFAIGVASRPDVPGDLKAAVTATVASDFAREIERTPLDARLRLQYSYAIRSTGDYQSAMREIMNAQQLAPRKQNLILEEGILQLELKNYPAARAAFLRAYELSPTFDDLAAYVAAGDIIAGDKARAKAFLAERFGTSTVLNSVLILAYYETKDYAELTPLLEERARTLPDDPTAHFQLATIYVEAGKVTEGRRVLTEFMTAHPEYGPQIMSYLAELAP